MNVEMNVNGMNKHILLDDIPVDKMTLDNMTPGEIAE